MLRLRADQTGSTSTKGLERYFEEYALLPPGWVDPDHYQEITERSWTEVVGTPLAISRAR